MAKTKTPAEEVAEAVEEVTAPDMTEMESPAEGSAAKEAAEAETAEAQTEAPAEGE